MKLLAANLYKYADGVAETATKTTLQQLFAARLMSGADSPTTRERQISLGELERCNRGCSTASHRITSSAIVGMAF